MGDGGGGGGGDGAGSMDVETAGGPFVATSTEMAMTVAIAATSPKATMSHAKPYRGSASARHRPVTGHASHLTATPP